jgi:hypothetical protein
MITIRKDEKGTHLTAYPDSWKEHGIGVFEFTASFTAVNEPYGNDRNAVSLLLEMLGELRREAELRLKYLSEMHVADMLIHDTVEQLDVNVDLGNLGEQALNAWRQHWADLIQRYLR